jgi:hypothetical protein
MLNNNLNLFMQCSRNDKKILLKQSYILLTWFYYLSFLSTTASTPTKTNQLKISILPTIHKKFTLTKAPMAHRNWSKEQYKFQFYKFKVSFHASLRTQNQLTTLNQGLLFVLLSKKFFPQFESNLFFLKYYLINFYVIDRAYFSFFNFCRQ